MGKVGGNAHPKKSINLNPTISLEMFYFSINDMVVK
jgi:hypothetical protein